MSNLWKCLNSWTPGEKKPVDVQFIRHKFTCILSGATSRHAFFFFFFPRNYASVAVYRATRHFFGPFDVKVGAKWARLFVLKRAARRIVRQSRRSKSCRVAALAASTSGTRRPSGLSGCSSRECVQTGSPWFGSQRTRSRTRTNAAIG